MRLLTHNLLACAARSCLTTSQNFPLAFKDVELEIVETEYSETFMRGLLGGGKIEWKGLVDTCRSLGEESLPEAGPDRSDGMVDEELLKKLHHILLEIHVVQGSMVCPNCSHNYAIRNGIPNMLLAEHEVQR